MCISTGRQSSNTQQRVPAQAVDDVPERPIELITADKDVKKKKKLASKSGTSALQTGLNTSTSGSASGVSYSA